jgi:hypothetical protein
MAAQNSCSCYGRLGTVKKIIALTAFMAWQILAATNTLGQQRPGGSQRPSGDGQAVQLKTSPGKSAKKQPAKQSTKQAASSVRPASHPGVVVEGDVVHEGYVESAPVSDCDSCGEAGCSSCSVSGYDSLCDQNYGRLYISLPAHGWVHAEGLTWYQSGMRLPALVTTSPVGTARAAAGVLGQQGTSVLFGDDDNHLSDSTGGFRIRFGTWFGAIPGWGIEGEYVGLSEKNESFFDQSTGATGSRILARPFFNMLTGQNDAELVSFPNVVRGSIGVDLSNRLDGSAFRFRRQLCCNTGCGFSDWACQTVPVSTRLDLTAGYRFWQLAEGLSIREQLTTLNTSTNQNAVGNFDIVDDFETRNQFNGAELGLIWQGRRGWWSMDALMRVGIGNMLQTVNIDGSTAITENNQTDNYGAGFLTQRTNIGTYSRDRFTMIPELGVNVGYQMTRRLRATVGYSLIYFGNVVRPGDQIDLDVNTNLLPPENTPFTGALRPQFQFQQTDYWVQGLSFGGEFRW